MRISDHILIGEHIAHDAGKIIRGIRHPLFWKKGLWYGITTSPQKESILYILSGREMRQNGYRNSNLRLLGLAGSRKEAHEIVLQLVQSGYHDHCIHRMKEYLENY